MTRENLQDLIQSKSSSHRVYANQDVTPTRNPNGEPFLTFCTCFASGLCLYLRLQLLFTCSCSAYNIYVVTCTLFVVERRQRNLGEQRTITTSTTIQFKQLIYIMPLSYTL